MILAGVKAPAFYFMGEIFMKKQLELKFGGYRIPDFESWYAENSRERRADGLTIYDTEKAENVYQQLIDNKRDFPLWNGGRR